MKPKKEYSPNNYIDLAGKKFNHLTILKRSGHYLSPGGQKQAVWQCRCFCGNIVNITSQKVRSGHTKSCGCLRQEAGKVFTKHGMYKTRFYNIWNKLKGRCLTKTDRAYKDYGGRGIKICTHWIKFENFRNDMYESYQKHCAEFGEKQTTIDRINNNRNYTKKNCRWANTEEQARNRRSNLFFILNGQTKTLIEWCEIYGLNYKRTWKKIKIIGLTLQEIIHHL